MKAIIAIRLKPEVPDAAGRVVNERLIDMGFGEAKETRIGKLVEIDLEGADKDAAMSRIKQMCERMLVNSVIEDYVIVSLE